MRFTLLLALLVFTVTGQLAGQSSPAEFAAYESGLALVKQNRVEEAGRYLDSLSRYPDGTLRQDSLGVLIQFALGRNYTNPTTLDAGIPYFERALRMADSLFTQPSNLRARIRMGLSEALITTDRERAILLVEEASDMYPLVPEPDTAFWVRGLWNLARCYELEENFGPAENAIQLAMRLSENSRAVPVSTKFLVFYEAAMLNSSFRNADPQGLAYAQTALAYAKQQPDPTYVVAAYNLLGSIYRKQDKVEEQQKVLRQNLAFSRNQVGMEYILGDIYVALANSYRRAANLPEALASAESAVGIQREFDPSYLHYGLSTRGKVHAAAGRYARALEDHNESLRLLAGDAVEVVDGLPYFVKDSLRGITLATNAYVNRSDLFVAMREPTLALKDMEAIIALRESQRQSVNLSASQFYLSETLSEFYGRAVDLHYELRAEGEDHLWQALLLSDKAKGFSLLASLNERREAENELLSGLRAEIAKLELAESPGEDETKRLFAARLELERLVRKTRRKIPPVREYTVADLRRHIAEMESDVLAYHFGLDNSYVFYLPAEGGISMARINDPEELAGAVDAWREAIIGGAYRGKSLRPAAEQAALDEDFLRLGKKLAGTLLPQNADDVLNEHLLIIPDGPINYLPLAALPVGEAALPLNYAEANYLKTDRRIRYAYSLRYLREVTELPEVAPRYDLIAFAPSFGGSATAMEVSRSVSRSGRSATPDLLPLMHNIEEVQKISGEITGSLAFTGKDATRSRFNEVSGEGKVIHLSSHGMVDAANPKGSFVAFSPASGKAEGEDLLFFNELPAMDINAELVVLSACETSLGSTVPGENVLSLGSAFAAAGAQGTLTTLWKVDDEAIQRLMVKFYDGLRAGERRSVALSGAQTQQLTESTFAHPYYWAASLLHGVDDPIELSSRWWPKWAWWGLLLPLVGLAWWVVRRRRTGA